jgi:hypothetical protein
MNFWTPCNWRAENRYLGAKDPGDMLQSLDRMRKVAVRGHHGDCSPTKRQRQEHCDQRTASFSLCHGIVGKSFATQALRRPSS